MADSDGRSTWQEILTELCAAPELAAQLYPHFRASDLCSPEEQDFQLAWVMYTQLRTRIATQPLPIRDGIESTAPKSLVDLFTLSRDAMADRRLALHATSLLVHCLNHHIRPFTARWHAKSEAGELSILDAMMRIDYGVVDSEGLPIYGLLLVIKLALTGNESELLMRYRREYPSFPHQSTVQQLFSEAQFEAYRALGEHAADAAFDPLLTRDTYGSVSDWLRQLEQRLLPIAC